MPDQLKRYEKYASSVKSLLLSAGFWPDPACSKLFRRYVIIHVITNIIIVYGQIHFIVNNITDIGLMTKTIGLFISFFGTTVKGLIIAINRHCLVEMHDILDVTFRKDLDNKELRAVMLPLLKHFVLTYWVTRPIILTPVIFSALPMISIVIQVARGTSPIKYRLPYLSQYPWDYAGNIALYATYYVIETMGSIGVGLVVASIDTFFGLSMFKLSSQFRALSYRMNNLKATDDYRATIKECVDRHSSLTKCRDSLQQIYGPIVIWMMMTSAICVCCNIFQTSKMSSDSFVVTALYIFVKLAQVLVYAWWGMLLTTETESFRDAIYNCEWPTSGDRSLMTNVLMMLATKPLALTACHFAVVSLDIFAAVANTALSYFFLLRTLEEGH